MRGVLGRGALVLILFSSPCLAADYRTLFTPKGSEVIIWRSESAMNDGLKLLDAKAGSAEVKPYVACVPAKGTRIILSEPGLSSSSVIVADGQYAGCRGVIPNSSMK